MMAQRKERVRLTRLSSTFRTNPESIKSRLFGEILRLGGSRKDKDAREEEEDGEGDP